MTAEQGSPTTRLLSLDGASIDLDGDGGAVLHAISEHVRKREAEARQQALTDAIAAVEGLPMTFGVHTCWDDHMGEGGVHEDGSECHDRILGESVGRAAVIDTLTRLREGS